MIRTVIFDLDGLLSDTERLHIAAYQEVLGRYGVALTDEEYSDHWITRGLGIADFVRLRSLDLDPATLRNEKAVVYHDLLKTDLRPMPYALELLQALRGKKRLALASSSYRPSVERVLAELKIADFFEVIVTGTEVAKSKPAPDIFVKAAELLGAPPSECIVLEDAQKGVIAANRAHIRVIAVPNGHTANDDFSTADFVVGSLREAEPILWGEA